MVKLMWYKVCDNRYTVFWYCIDLGYTCICTCMYVLEQIGACQFGRDVRVWKINTPANKILQFCE